MIYYCMYKDKCSFKGCAYRKTKSKFSAGRDLTINGFDCIMIGNKPMRLVSDERIICNRYQECNIICKFKTIYITTSNFEKHLGKLDLSKPYKCKNTGYRIKLSPAGKLIGNYVNIWDKPSLFIKKIAKEE